MDKLNFDFDNVNTIVNISNGETITPKSDKEENSKLFGEDGVIKSSKEKSKTIPPNIVSMLQDKRFNTKDFLDSLPPDGEWKKGSAPANRLKALDRELSMLKNKVITAMHKDNISSDEQQEVMEHIGAFRQAVDETTANFPNPGGINIDIPFSFTSAETYNEGEEDVKDAHEGLKEGLQDLESNVRTSLETPGSSKNETKKGFFRKQPVDKIINKLFDEADEFITVMFKEASRIHMEGNTIANEAELGFFAPEMKTTRKEGEKPSAKDYIPAGTVIGKIAIATLENIFRK